MLFSISSTQKPHQAKVFLLRHVTCFGLTLLEPSEPERTNSAKKEEWPAALGNTQSSYAKRNDGFDCKYPMTAQRGAELVPDKPGLDSYRFLVPQQAKEQDEEEPFAGAMMTMTETNIAVNFGGGESTNTTATDSDIATAETKQYINQFGQMARSTSSKLFRGSNAESVNSLASLGQTAAHVTEEQDEKKETDSAVADPTKHDVVNQFGCVQRVESCVLFGVEDEIVKAVVDIDLDKDDKAEAGGAENHATSTGGAAANDQVAVNFGEDESRKKDEAPRGRFLNQFGEVTRRTSYKLFRGGNGSATSLSSLVNFWGGSELGSSLGSVNELSAMVDDGHVGATPSTDENKRAPVQEVTNQFGAIARVESAALFRSESAGSLALSSTAVPPTTAPEDLDADFF